VLHPPKRDQAPARECQERHHVASPSNSLTAPPVAPAHGPGGETCVTELKGWILAAQGSSSPSQIAR
jgi:hypothetical protein